MKKVIRYKTLAISCFVLLGTMFVVPATIWAIFLASLKHGLPGPLPVYERVLLDLAVFCGIWKWLVLPLAGLGVAFSGAEVASSRVSR